MSRKSKPIAPKPVCTCPIEKLVPLSIDVDGYKMYYCKDCMEFRKPEKENNDRHRNPVAH